MAIEWMKKIRETPGANVMAINVIKMWMCQLVLGPIYPTYYYIFTTMAERAQNLIHHTDEMPETIAFNAEVSSALFVSYCMQNSSSVWATLELMIVDIAMVAPLCVISIWSGLKELEQRIHEFLLLLNYVEVVIPLVFSIYMVTYQLPNREYYAQLHGMTQGELMQTLENVP
ncbi:hypothetical protein PC121_g19385 [Phytophthora cactorum]|nr:hypothetical protein PC121_g19385 [Phytophthora cactorum]